MAKRTSKPKPKGKKIITPAFKREIEKARRDLAKGKGSSVGELLTRAALLVPPTLGPVPDGRDLDARPAVTI